MQDCWCTGLNSVRGSWPPSTWEHGIGKQGLCRYDQIEKRAFWIRVCPHPLNDVLIRTGISEHGHTQREDRGGDWSYAATSQGMPGATKSWNWWGKIPSLKPSERAGPFQHLNSLFKCWHSTPSTNGQIHALKMILKKNKIFAIKTCYMVNGLKYIIPSQFSGLA